MSEKTNASELPVYAPVPPNGHEEVYVEFAQPRARRGLCARTIVFTARLIVLFCCFFLISFVTSGALTYLFRSRGKQYEDVLAAFHDLNPMDALSGPGTECAWRILEPTSDGEGYTASHETTVPLSRGPLHLVSPSLPSGGAVNFHPYGHCGDSVKVVVTLKGATPRALEGLNVCGTHNQPSARPVFGLSKDIGAALGPGAGWSMDVYLPRRSAQPIHLKTDLWGMKHSFGNLSHVNIGTLSVDARGTPLTAQSVTADSLSLMTDNSPIEGSFTVTRSLVLETTNGHIDVDVTMQNAGHGFTNVHMKTTNARLDASLSLEKKQNGGGLFLARAETTNAELHVDFPTAPADSTLQFRGKTTNKAAFTSLHTSYEGTFELRTTNAAADVHYSGDVEDPAGRGRSRHLEKNRVSKGRASGSVSWQGGDSEDVRSHGWVVLETTNAAVDLTL